MNHPGTPLRSPSLPQPYRIHSDASSSFFLSFEELLNTLQVVKALTLFATLFSYENKALTFFATLFSYENKALTFFATLSRYLLSSLIYYHKVTRASPPVNSYRFFSNLMNQRGEFKFARAPAPMMIVSYNLVIRH